MTSHLPKIAGTNFIIGFISSSVMIFSQYFSPSFIRRTHNLAHCSKSSFFVQKFNFVFPQKLLIFFGGEKLVKMLRFWTFYLLTTLISREKLPKKFWWKTRENVGFSNSVCGEEAKIFDRKKWSKTLVNLGFERKPFEKVKKIYCFVRE